MASRRSSAATSLGTALQPLPQPTSAILPPEPVHPQDAAAERVRKILEAPRPHRQGLPKLTAPSVFPRGRSHSGRVFRKEERLATLSIPKGTNGLEYIQDQGKRLTSYNTRKTQLLKKAHELSVCTGADVLVLVASDVGSVYTFASSRLKRFLNDSEVVGRLEEALSQDDVDEPNDSDGGDPSLLDLDDNDDDDDDDDVLDNRHSHGCNSLGYAHTASQTATATLLPPSLSLLRTQPPAKMPKLSTTAVATTTTTALHPPDGQV